MTVDLNKEQIEAALIDESDQTMATTITANNHFKTNISSTSSQESIDLSSKLSQMHLRDRHSDSNECKIPRRQPTIVCEDIADDIEIENNETFSYDEKTLETISGIDQSNDAMSGSLQRSASTASLTVPQTIEGDQEKRRPPLSPEQMVIESTDMSNSS